MATDFDAFIETAWTDHADDAVGVADRLAASLGQVEAPAHVAPYARLVTHVYGEHLARYDDGVALLARLRALPAAQDAPEPQAAIARGVATLRYCAGDAAALEALPHDDRIVALATAAAAFVGQKAIRAAIDAYAAALGLASAGLADGSPALRALAVGGNNLAAELEEKPDRDAFETRAMLAAAQGGLDCWRRAGGWLEEERAEFRLSSSRRAAGEYDGAILHAERCLALCRAHDAPPLEHFFGLAALALAQRSAGLSDEFARTREAARECHTRIDPDDRAWCEAALASLDDAAVAT